MSRPAGASFAQFFPAAPRAARDRALERERAKINSQDSPLPQAAEACGQDTGSTSAGSYHRHGPAANGAHPSTDDSESLPGDTLTSSGSASSHASSSSSLFCALSRPGTAAAFKGSSSHLTPPTSDGSPSSYPSASLHSKAQSTASQPTDSADSSMSIPNGSSHDHSATLSKLPNRLPPFDPSHKVVCVKCKYDPALDATISSSEKRKRKPEYVEFGLVCTLNSMNTLTIPKGERHLECELMANTICVGNSRWRSPLGPPSGQGRAVELHQCRLSPTQSSTAPCPLHAEALEV